MRTPVRHCLPLAPLFGVHPGRIRTLLCSALLGIAVLPLASLGQVTVLYDNSTTPTDTGTFEGRMVVRIPANTSRAVSLPVDNTSLKALCADKDGCHIALGVEGWRFNAEHIISGTYFSPTCRFSMTASVEGRRGDVWSTSIDCSQYFVTCPVPSRPCPNPDGLYIPYWAGAFGIDGVDRGGADRYAVIHNRACYFTESRPNYDSQQGELEPDSKEGFFLTASHPSWAGPFWPGDRFWRTDDPNRACVLVVDD
jgi:hypothetical protein